MIKVHKFIAWIIALYYTHIGLGSHSWKILTIIGISSKKFHFGLFIKFCYDYFDNGKERIDSYFLNLYCKKIGDKNGMYRITSCIRHPHASKKYWNIEKLTLQNIRLQIISISIHSIRSVIYHTKLYHKN